MIDKPNFIEVYNNVFDKEWCDYTIEYFNKYQQLGFTKNRQDHDNSDKLYKEDESLFLPDQDLNLEHTNTKIVDVFNEKFWAVAYKQYAEKYTILNNLSPHKIYSMKLQKTEPGQGYHVWHCESGTRESSNRILTWTVYLNDNFEAGETEFLYQQYRYKPKQGDVVIFPAAFTHTHRGNPPIGGDKYIITGWVEF
jgi:hypothetical protein